MEIKSVLPYLFVCKWSASMLVWNKYLNDDNCLIYHYWLAAATFYDYLMFQNS